MNVNNINFENAETDAIVLDCCCIINFSSLCHCYVYLMSFLFHACTRNSQKAFALHLVTSVEYNSFLNKERSLTQ